MAKETHLKWEDVFERLARFDMSQHRIYGIPRGGMICTAFLNKAQVVHEPERATLFIDDIIDSGRTRKKFRELYPTVPFHALVDKTKKDKDLGWVVFPWENNEDGADDIIVRLLQYIGEDPTREGLLETPKRALKAWKHWTKGYAEDPKEIAKAFTDGAENVDEMVVVKEIPIWSMCEHHMAPFFGTAHVAYIPDDTIMGLSKFARIADIFARRLQVQERLTNQIADAIEDCLSPRGIGVRITCRHLCMESRGVQTHNTETTTTAVRGLIKQDSDARYEFLSSIQ